VVPGTAKRGLEGLRRRTLAGLKGTVVEVGVEDGAKFAFHPDEVERIVAVEAERLTWPEGARGPGASVIVGCVVAA